MKKAGQILMLIILLKIILAAKTESFAKFCTLDHLLPTKSIKGSSFSPLKESILAHPDQIRHDSKYSLPETENSILPISMARFIQNL
ncbi:MAG: hypothetical protein C5B52_13705 [Bacteroidetes bacterium]|nr:MAG: hypothetical protein C5B52_13705 [Bacteroidota bacterium]